MTMPGGSTVTITFTVNIATSVAPGTYTNSVTPSYLDPQRITSSGEASGAGTGPTAPVTVTPSADVAVTKTASAPTINDGQEVTFTVTAKNNGPDAASGVAVTDLLPAGLEYVSSSVSQGSYERARGVWTVGGLANAASATLTVTAKATKTGSITNTATKTAEEQNDPVAGHIACRRRSAIAAAALSGASLLCAAPAPASSLPVGAPSHGQAWVAKVIYPTAARSAPSTTARRVAFASTVSAWGTPEVLLVRPARVSA
jgi:uncharacterized repeat protein (TIGR01451 family)